MTQPNVLTRPWERLLDSESNTLIKEKLGEELYKRHVTPHIKGQGPKVGCSFCCAMDRKLRVCERCKSNHYCSRECQKRHWPTHKNGCNPVDRSNPLKLLRFLAGNAKIMHVLEIAIAIDLDFANDKKHDVGFKFPFMATVDVGVEPWNLNILELLLLSDLPVPQNIDGVVQIHSLHCGIPGRDMPPVDLGPWKAARDFADMAGSRDLPVGLWNFSLNGVGPFTLVGHPIHHFALRYGRETPPISWVSSCEGNAQKKEAVLSVPHCLSFINSLIRADTEDQLKLRTRMTKTEIATIRYAMNESVNMPQVVAFRERVASYLAPALGLT